ncbi:protein-L-isoaspartate(D-aspartate) O-methyltransferase [Psychrobium sp. 1_MG-2023]|uniref:protein-L-isoaspartate(D-aspartate) O-methyltransferase n=1 Tax=Psychrobium sp. 1_MG-2023 TaxID=3062624 RepID=UPI000C341CED|nr:protein-L-isoaspartate(D-aspartate) O-methyltransferase [Psychrobium sp. 1_MG-2023]MDP2562383.1 protein-L-isoaspartate(D-aspartate) O-methyltransferase [Psychrobium sp. 1_MG-2023]PKF55852.1 protein-L-isoaspartate O-methyltransferase [Alteromonadales bacterium alter-6D02]
MSTQVKASTLHGQRLAKRLAEDGVNDPRVLEVIAATPRQIFIDQALEYKAYENTALPIGHGQTISQPYIVARMTQVLLAKGPLSSVLEIGTGSGYQCAVLAQLVEHVYTVERIKALQRQAKRRLRLIDLHNVSMKHGDGWQGWAAKGPFDAIMVTAAPDQVPVELLKQLKDGGQMIIPVGVDSQTLMLITREGERFAQQRIEAVKFVPLLAGELC